MAKSMSKLAIGIDQSFSQTGLAFIWKDGKGEVKYHVVSLGTKAGVVTESKAANLEAVYHRALTMRSKIKAVVNEFLADNFSYQAKDGTYKYRKPEITLAMEMVALSTQNHHLTGLWWILWNWQRGFADKFLDVPSSTVKKFATGKDRGEKPTDEVQAAFPLVKVNNSDKGDALIMADMAWQFSGEPSAGKWPFDKLCGPNKKKKKLKEIQEEQVKILDTKKEKKGK
jgi:hypothetical protein